MIEMQDIVSSIPEEEDEHRTPLKHVPNVMFCRPQALDQR